MNKQEIECKLEQAICIRDSINRQILEFESQLAEAEKSKLGHGDFGLWKFRPTNDPQKAIYIDRHGTKDTIYTDKDEWCTNASDDDGSKLTKFGNIFDLMEGWDKDFKNVVMKNSYNDRVFLIQKSLLAEKDIYLGTEDLGHKMGVYLTISEAEEIWKQLGHAIISAKRSNRVCSFTNEK